MGNKNSTNIDIEDVTRIVSQSITKSIQSVNVNSNWHQLISINCAEIIDRYLYYYIRCVELGHENGIPNPAEECARNFPIDAGFCNINNIKQSMFVQINLSDKQILEVESYAESNLEKEIKLAIEQETGFVLDSNEVNQKIRSLSESILLILNELIQEIKTDINGSQVIETDAGNISFVTQENTTSFIADRIQSNRVINELISDTVSVIDIEVSQSSGNLLEMIKNIIMWLGVAGIVVLVFIFVFRMIIKRTDAAGK